MADPDPTGEWNATNTSGTFGLLWPVIGNGLPTGISNAFFREIGRLDLSAVGSEATRKHHERLILTYQGLLAAYYHRDRIESIEREIVRRIRAAPPEILRPGATASGRMPVVGHEFVAYLLAARRTLDYLARGVGSCFNQSSVYKITKLASAVADLPPGELATQVVEQCAGVVDRFPHLLSEDARLSDRDRAAHYWPIEPAFFLIVHFPTGGIGLELRDGGHGYLPTHGDLDLDRMSRDEALLTTAIDSQLDELSSFCNRLIAIAVDAELALRPQ